MALKRPNVLKVYERRGLGSREIVRKIKTHILIFSAEKILVYFSEVFLYIFIAEFLVDGGSHLLPMVYEYNFEM